jgi:serine/threonine protein kinase
MKQLAQALQYMHSQTIPIIHRDVITCFFFFLFLIFAAQVKTEHLFLSADLKTAKLGDFGLAIFRQSSVSAHSAHGGII